MRVAVTGGTGTFGRYLIPRLLEGGHHPIVVSRSHGAAPEGATRRVADVATGDGLAQAFSDAEVIIHAATNPARPRQTEVDGARNVVATADDRHVVYLSIVGVDQHRFPYYKAKFAGETIISGAPQHSILRATQFHDLLDWWLGLPAFFATPHMAFQLIDGDVVAQRVVSLVGGAAGGRLADIGGPRAIPMAELAATRRRHAKTARLIRMPVVGFFADFDAGRHINMDAAVDEGRSWEEFLRLQHGS